MQSNNYGAEEREDLVGALMRRKKRGVSNNTLAGALAANGAPKGKSGVQVKTLNFNAPASKANIANKKRLAQAMAARASRQQQFTHPEQAWAPFGQTLASALLQAQASGKERERAEYFRNAASEMGAPSGYTPEAWQTHIDADPEAAWNAGLKARQDAAQAQAQWNQFVREHQFKNANQPDEWVISGNHRMNKRTGEVEALPNTGGGLFDGNSVEAQALNHLISTGQLSREQAANIGAGKVITDPSTNQLVFATPQSIYPLDGMQSQGGGQPYRSVLDDQPQQSPQATQSQGTGVLDQAPLNNVPQPQPGSTPNQLNQSPGLIPITGGKTDANTESQRNMRANIAAARSALDDGLDRYIELVKQNGIEVMPGKAKDSMVSVRQGLMLQLKELFNLGVLNGPDLELMEKMIYDAAVDPFKEGGLQNVPDQLWTAATGGAAERAINSATELKNMISDIYDSRFGEGQVPTPRQAEPASGESRAGEPIPQPGDVSNGYRFNGGDPNDQNNWQKVEP